MFFKRPTGRAIVTLATFVFGGLGVAYLPTQISEAPGFQNTWQALWGPVISALGLLTVAIAMAVFVVTHIRWPLWISDLGRLRVRFYKTPHRPDVFLADAQSRLVGSCKVIKKTVDLKPYGWDERDPFVRITYHVFNGSLFPVFFTNPRGNLYVSKSKLHEPPTLVSGEGWWPSQETAQLKIDQKLKKGFWDELAQYDKPDSVMESLIGYFSVSLSFQTPGVKTTGPIGLSLHSDNPYLTERQS